MKQYDAVIQTLERIGGIATLAQLNQRVFDITNCEWLTKTPLASIRRIVQVRPEIYKIRPGLYGLTKYRKKNEQNGVFEETAKNKNSKEIVDFNHSYYQGLILELGNLKKLGTYVPNQDKNKKYINTPLGDIGSLKKIPEFSYPGLVHRSSTIDVIWFNDRKMPHSFFEVEHSTDIQNSLLKFNDLQDFYARMIIVADRSRRHEYEHKIQYSSFKEIRPRMQFLDYEGLSKQHTGMIEQQSFELTL